MRPAPPRPDPTTTRIHRVLDYIRDNLDGDLSLDELANVAALSRFHFHRVFRGVVGASVAQAVRRIRLHNAATNLVHKNDPVAVIGMACGYPDPDSFARAFSDVFGLTPTAYRQRGALRIPVDRSFSDPNAPTSEKDMPDIEIRSVPALRLAALEHLGAYHEISVTFDKLSAATSAQNLWPQVRGMIGVYFDDPSAVPEAELRSMAGWILPEGVELAAPLFEHRIDASQAAVLVHKGPYSGLKSSYDILYGDWLRNSGRTPAPQPSYERYLNSPMDTAPDDLLTEICLPLADG